VSLAVGALVLLAALAAPATAQGLAVPAPAAMSAELPAAFAGAEGEAVQVADPFIELHTGPGRGYPVFHVATRGEWVLIELRHTDWFRLRTARGQQGWVTRAQLQGTLTQAGTPKTFRDIALDDYLQRRLELGAAYGRFSKEPMLEVRLGYRLSDTFTLEGGLGQVQGVFSGTDFWHLALMSEPWSDRRLSPFFALGMGRFKNIPNTSLVGATTTNANLGQATLGLRWHLGERFVARAQYTIYTAFLSDARSGQYRAFNAGVSFFF
jgi:SH3-like domain-containing protein